MELNSKSSLDSKFHADLLDRFLDPISKKKMVVWVKVIPISPHQILAK
jgi:hypothetical protein